MIGIENKDSSFFTVESPDVTLENQDFSKDLISLTITEKTSAMPQGTLQFRDPNHYYSRILRTGARLRISWGYKNTFSTPDSLIEKTLNFDEVSGDLIRRGYEGFVSSPTGGGSRDGFVTYNCNFTAYRFRGADEPKVYRNIKKKDVISMAFDDLGISLSNRFIDFSLGNDTIEEERQYETTYAFLLRKAIDYHAFIHIAFSPSGEPVGYFIDEAKIGSEAITKKILGATGKSNVLGYKGKLNNVISYTWTSSEAESGAGDNVQLDIVDRQIVFRQYAAEEDSVVTWRLDVEKISEAYSGITTSGELLKLTEELISKNDFEQIKHFFTPVESPTAPNGYGYKINAEMIGNPLCIPGNLIRINNGFPDRLGGSQSKWYIQGVTHKIDRSGYFMSVEIVDVFYLSPIGEPIREQ